jgi:TolB-like protein/DNA-binding winged helix-turn-helix (wHTH) protein
MRSRLPGCLKQVVIFGEDSVKAFPHVYNSQGLERTPAQSPECVLNPGQAISERFRIGDLELDTGTASVCRATTPVELPKLSFDLLLCLARHAPNVVDTETLMEQVWGKVVVGEETVKQRVKLLRKALGDSSVEPKYVASVRGRGYRLVAAVKPLRNGTASQVSGGARHGGLVVGGIALILLVGIGFIFRQAWLPERPQAPVTDQSANARRIAVLPFDNFSGQQEDSYLADGITEDITSALAQVEGLGVIARTTMMRYRNSRLSVSEIALELEVGTILEGSVQRFGELLRITVQMIDAGNEEHYWAQTFDVALAELPEMQFGVAKRVANSLEATISEVDRLGSQRGSTDNSAAYDAYLKGRDYYRRWSSQDNETALAFYQQAVELDPDFALAQAGVANAYALRSATFGAGHEWAEKAIHQAELALSLNPLLPEAHKALGLGSFVFGHYQDSINHYLKAIDLNPNYDEALFNLAELYELQGRWDESVRYQMRDSQRAHGAVRLAIYLRNLQLPEEAGKLLAQTSDEVPISFSIEGSLSLHYLLTDEFDQARAHAQRMLVSFPEFAFSWQRAAEIEIRAGHWDAAQPYIEKSVALSGRLQPYPRLLLAQLMLRRGENGPATVILDEVEALTLEQIDRGHEAWFHRWNMAFVQTLRGEHAQAVDWYLEAVEAGRMRYEWDEQDTVFLPLRSDSRFQAALEKQRQQRARMRARVVTMLDASRQAGRRFGSG